MKRYTLYTFSALALLLAATARCGCGIYATGLNPAPLSR